MMMNKQFRVVKIINDMKVVVNAGSSDLIERGSKLEIYTIGEEVIDPDTNKSLGTLDTIKAYIEVVDVFPKMCICRNTETKTYNALLGLQSFVKEEIKPLTVDPKQITGGLNNTDKVIQIGDLVRKSAG